MDNIFSSIICTLCTGFFYLAIIKDPPMILYFIIEGPSKSYFTEKNFTYSINILI